MLAEPLKRFALLVVVLNGPRPTDEQDALRLRGRDVAGGGPIGVRDLTACDQPLLAVRLELGDPAGEMLARPPGSVPVPVAVDKVGVWDA